MGLRHRSSRSRRGGFLASPLLVVGVGALMVIALVGIALGSAALRSARAQQADVAQLSLAPEPPSSVDSTLVVSTVEIPELLGLELTEAETVLSAAGFPVQVKSGAGHVDSATDTVAEQTPEPGVLVDVGTTVVLTLRSAVDSGAGSLAKAASDEAGRGSWVVCVDPGHQGRSDSSPEPIGPGSKQTKVRVTGGATGVVTEVPEYEVALQISMNVAQRLRSQGVRVVMTRTTNDVNISNAERAAIANKSKADLFVRIHGNGNPDSTVVGVAAVYPAANTWTKSIAAPSKRAATWVQSALVAQTGAVDRGLMAQRDHAGFNWSRVPAVLVECGYLSNSVEDRLLVSPHYQDKVAQAIASGVVAYLEAEERR
jgi:N-acetylmuramoyl-L-alanine amidase